MVGEGGMCGRGCGWQWGIHGRGWVIHGGVYVTEGYSHLTLFTLIVF